MRIDFWAFFISMMLLTTFPSPGSAETEQYPSNEFSESILQFDGANQDRAGTRPLKFPGLEGFAGEFQDNQPRLMLASNGDDFEEGPRSSTSVPPTYEETTETLSDPFEPINRVFYHFNDKLYFWLLKPAATGYKAVVPQMGRVGVRNFFYNLAFPIRFVNCLLQGKVNGAGLELTSFTVNSTVGMAGFVDIASKNLKIEKQVEDFDQTLGVYGFGPGFYITWPIIGPSSVRNTLGIFADGLLDPVNYIVDETKYNIAVKVYKTINNTSLVIGDYEDLKEAALDPYISIRDAYWQNRQSKVKK